MGERSEVAIVFCDLVDSTAILSRLGDVANDELRRDLFAALRAPVAAAAGEEVKTQGDGMMAVFPSADDAVAGAVEMQLAVARLDARDRDLRLALRVGVGWGEATSEENDWFGTPVVEAARLCGAARAGQVLITDATRRALVDAERDGLVDVGAIVLKGLPEPRRTWAVPWARESESGPIPVPPALQVPIGSTLVGRDGERVRLLAAWDAADAGRPRAVVVHGPAGAGATRLAAELAGEVGDAVVLSGRATAGGDGTEVLAEALRWFVTGSDRDDLRRLVDDLRPDLDRALPSIAARLGPAPVEPDRPGTDRASGHGPAGSALVDLFDRINAEHPVLLVVDDAHLLGPVGVEVVDGLIAGRAPDRRVVVVAGRTGGGAGGGLEELRARWAGRDGVDEVALGPLADDAVAELLGLEVEGTALAEVREATESLAGRVVALRRHLPTGPLTPADVRRAVAGTAPYKGLGLFGPEDRGLFHGRDRPRDQVLERLAHSRVVVLVGASGSGKSSLVRAGVLPALADGALPGSARWPQATIVPGRDPIGAVEEAIDRIGADGVLFVDQLEEIATLGLTGSVRAGFVGALTRADGGPHRVIATLRADLVGAVAAIPGASALLDQSTLFLPPMTEAEMRAAIEQPAAAVGLRLEAGLVDLVLADVGGRHAALPLVSHAMYETWQRRRGNVLTVAAYREAGRVEGAVARTADDVYRRRLDAAAQGVARTLLLALVEPGEGAEDSRRAVPRRDLVASAGDAADGAGVADRVIEALVASRLLTTDADDVELAHEALIRAWPRLRGWLDEDREAIVVHRRLGRSAVEWDRGGRSEADLFRGGRLDTAVEVVEGSGRALAETEQAFLDASVALREREADAAAAAARRDRRTNRRLRALLAVGVLALLVAAVAAVAAVRQRDTAQALADAADARAAALRIGAVASEDPGLAPLVAAEAHALASGPETTAGLLAALVTDGRWVSSVDLGGDGIVAFAPETAEVVVVTSGAIERRPVTGGSPTRVELMPGLGTPVGTSPDGTAVVVQRASGEPTGDGVVHLGIPTTLTVLDLDGEIAWSATLPDSERLLPGDTGQVEVAVSDGGEHLVTVAEDGIVVRSLSELGRMIPVPAGDHVAAMTISRDGTRVAVAVAAEPDATGTDAGGPVVAPTGASTVAVIDVATGDPISTVESPSPVVGLDLSPDGDRLAISVTPSFGSAISYGVDDLPQVSTPTVYVAAVDRLERPDRAVAGRSRGWVGGDVAIVDAGWVLVVPGEREDRGDMPYRAGTDGTADVVGDGRWLVTDSTGATGRHLEIHDRRRARGLLSEPVGPADTSRIVRAGRWIVAQVAGPVIPVGAGPRVVVLDADTGVLRADTSGVLGGAAADRALVDGRLVTLPDLEPVGAAEGSDALMRGELAPDGAGVAVVVGSSLVVRDALTGADRTGGVTLPGSQDGAGEAEATIRFDADGGRAVVRTTTGDVWVVDLATEEVVTTASGVTAAALDPTGTVLVLGSRTGEASVRDVDGDGAGSALSAAGEMIEGIDLAIGPSGDLLAAVSTGATTTLHDLGPARSVVTLPTPVSALTVGGDRLLLGTPVGLVSLSFDVDAWAEEACRRTGRTLTPAESERFFPGRAPRRACGDTG